MRGTLYPRSTPFGVGGIIPAYAGNTSASRKASSAARDHPRVCGEHSYNVLWGGQYLGSSPRMRGTHQMTGNQVSVQGIIPAYAGNTLRDYSNFVVSKFMSFVFHLV